jgi:8-oxo-dGTP pyrophosphatase MutT (NUDIX family)
LPSDLGRFLAGYAPDDVQMVEWGAEGNPGPLRVAGYLSRELPPLPYVTSVRAVVSRGDLVLVMRNRDGVHVLPGGQREPGETLVQTLEREVLEEAGWTIDVRVGSGFCTFVISGHDLRVLLGAYRRSTPTLRRWCFLRRRWLPDPGPGCPETTS